MLGCHMSIYLIRHGETAANHARVVQLPETPLSQRGLAQARRLAERLRGNPIGGVLASDLPRASQTASCVAEAVGSPLELEPLLRERDFGRIRGTAYADLDCDPFGPGYTPPGGESWAAFHARVQRACERIETAAAQTEGDLAVVTHGLVCHSIFAHHVQPEAGRTRPPSDGPPLRFGNTALSILLGARPWRVEVVACTAHLTGGEMDDPSAASGF